MAHRNAALLFLLLNCLMYKPGRLINLITFEGIAEVVEENVCQSLFMHTLYEIHSSISKHTLNCSEK